MSSFRADSILANRLANASGRWHFRRRIQTALNMRKTSSLRSDLRFCFAPIVGATLLLAATLSAAPATGRVIKVLPHYLDLKGRHTLSPSLYERDAYQAQLRQHPAERSALRFDIQWKAKDAGTAQLKLRAELRGVTKGNLPKQLVLEQPVKPKGHFSTWSALALSGAEYKEFGELTAWRVTLWDGEQLLGEQKSFLW